jgi:hypothetical protein
MGGKDPLPVGVIEGQSRGVRLHPHTPQRG